MTRIRHGRLRGKPGGYHTPSLNAPEPDAVTKPAVPCRIRPIRQIVVDVAVNVSATFAGQNVGIRQVDDKIWLVSFMQYDLGFFDHETCRITSAENPFSAKVLPMSPV